MPPDKNTNEESTRNMHSNHHDKLLRHDRETIAKMLGITKQLVDKLVPDNIRDLLINLGKLSFEIEHDENDPLCIRNQYGDYTDEKKKPREERYRESGIPFQGLFFIGKWLESNACINDADLKNWIDQHQDEFSSLTRKLLVIETGIFDVNVVTNIQQFGECTNDLLHLKITIEALEAFDIRNLDLNEVTSRYAIARIYSILGESAKCLSGTISNCKELRSIFQKLGQCRDLVKLPFGMPKTAKRMESAQQFLVNHGPALCIFFKSIRDETLSCLERSKLFFIDNYRNWLSNLLRQKLDKPAASLFSYIEIEMLKIKSGFKKTKNDEKAFSTLRDTIESDTELESEDHEDCLEIKLLEEKRISALRLVERYQSTYKYLEMHKSEYDDARKEDLRSYNQEQVKDKKRKQIRLKRIVEKETKQVRNYLEKYSNLYRELAGANSSIPEPTHNDLISMDITESHRKPNVQAKKLSTPKSALLKRYTSSVEDLFNKLDIINYKASLISEFAFDQCVSFIGQLFREISALHKLILTEPTSAVWDHDFLGTIKIRNQRLMHNVVHYNHHIVKNFVQSSIMPWGDHFRALRFIAEYHHKIETEKCEPTEVCFGDEVVFIGEFYYQLGLAYKELDQLSNAKKYLNLAIKHYKKCSDGKLANIMYALMEVHISLDEWKEATDWAILAYKHCTDHLPKSHEYQVSMLTSLGFCYQGLGENKNALNCYYKALELCKTHKHDHLGALLCLAEFFLNEADYPRALERLNEALKFSDCKKTKLYILKNLKKIAFYSGNYDKALEYYNEMKFLFQSNIPYFKRKWTSEYANFEKECQEPINILIQLDRFKEAQELLSVRASLSIQQKLERIDILLSMDQYEGARCEAKTILDTANTELSQDHDKVFIYKCKTQYGQSLMESGNLDDIKDGVSILKELCEHAEEFRRLFGIHSTDIIIAPHSILSAHYMRVNVDEKAIEHIRVAVSFLKNVKLAGLSSQCFITLIIYYNVHLLINKDGFNNEMTPYVPLILKYLGGLRSKKTYDAMVVLVNLLIEHNFLDIAWIYLSALSKNPHATKMLEPEKITPIYFELFKAYVESGKLDEGFQKLDDFLTRYCPKGDRARYSFKLAVLLYNKNNLEFFSHIVSTYYRSWDDKLVYENMSLFDFYSIMRGLLFKCAEFKINNHMHTEANDFVRASIPYVPKIYSLFSEMQPANKRKAELELFIQYWSMPRSISRLQHYEENRLSLLFFRLVIKDGKTMSILSHEADMLNVAFFGNELKIQQQPENPNRVTVTIPPHWHQFLSTFVACLPSNMRSGKACPLDVHHSLFSKKQSIRTNSYSSSLFRPIVIKTGQHVPTHSLPALPAP